MRKSNQIITLVLSSLLGLLMLASSAFADGLPDFTKLVSNTELQW